MKQFKTFISIIILLYSILHIMNIFNMKLDQFPCFHLVVVRSILHLLSMSDASLNVNMS